MKYNIAEKLQQADYEELLKMEKETRQLFAKLKRALNKELKRQTSTLTELNTQPLRSLEDINFELLLSVHREVIIISKKQEKLVKVLTDRGVIPKIKKF